MALSSYTQKWYTPLLRVVLPVLLTMILFLATFYLIAIPTMEEHLLDSKRNMIRQLTNTVWELLDDYHQRVQAGEIDLAEAKQRAKEQINSLRYGPEKKDYFWINDMQPKMIMHPYRTELNNKDVSNYIDPNGKKLFVEFVKTVRERDSGYVDYMWQWKDDSTKIVPKVSFVRLFEPWQWIIGTGIYIYDVEARIQTIITRLNSIFILIFVLLMLFAAMIVWQSLILEQRRRKAEERVSQTTKALQQERRIFISGPAVIFKWRNEPGWPVDYVSPNVEQVFGYTSEEFQDGKVSYAEIIDKDDLPRVYDEVKQSTVNQQDRFQHAPYRIIHKQGASIWLSDYTTILRDNQGNAIHYLGYVLDITEQMTAERRLRENEQKYRQLMEISPDGIVVANVSRRIIMFNNAAVKLSGIDDEEQLLGRDCLDLIMSGDRAKAAASIEQLFQEHAVTGIRVSLRQADGATVPVEIKSTLYRDDFGAPVGFINYIRDVSEHVEAELLQETLYAIAQAPDQAETLNQLYSLVQKTISRIMPAENFYIALYDEVEDVISFPYFVDAVDDPPQPRQIGRGITEYILRTGRSLICDDRVEASLVESGEIEILGGRSQIYLGVPLKVEDKTIGVMAVQHYEDIAAYRERERQMLEYVSVQVAKAIARKRNEAELRALMAAMPGLIIILNREGKYLSIPTDSHELLYLPAHELVGQTLHDVFPKEKADFFLEVVQRSLDNAVTLTIEYDLQIGDDVLWFEGKLSPIDSARSMFIVHDATARKKAEEQLRQSEEKFRALFEESHDAIYIRTPEGTILECNRAMANMFGYNREELIGRSIKGLYARDKDRIAFEKAMAEAGYVQNYEVSLLRKDGSLIWVVATASIHDKGAGETLYQGILRDITEQRHLQEQLLQAQKMEAVGRLAGGVAHDFNNLLTTIIGKAELTRIGLDDNSSIASVLDDILFTADKASDLTRQLLAFSRRQVISMQTINPNRNIENLTRLLKRIIGEDIRLKIELEEELWAIKADPTQIEQVLINLVVNARQAMPDGGTLTIRTANRQREDVITSPALEIRSGPYVMLEVEDTGHGMDETVRSRIFEPFFTTKPEGEGTGLGLATVFGVVQQQQGDIEVESEPGRGTIFRVYLPKISKSTAKVVASRIVASKDKQLTGSETILVIEDEESVRVVVRETLTHFGYAVKEASSVEKAMQMLEEDFGNIDIVLTDIVMPGQSGVDFYEKAVQQWPALKIIFMSGYTKKDSTQQILREGLPFLQKPFRPKDLVLMIRRTLDNDLSE